MDNMGAVLLAAGPSRRFGAENKLLVDNGGRALVRCVAEEIALSRARDLVAVTGFESARVQHALDGLPFRIVHNGSWEAGMGTSIAAGVSSLRPGTLAAFIVPGDLPLLRSQLLDRLIAAFEQSAGERIVFPATHAGEQRNPVLWPRRFFALLTSLDGPAGAKGLLGDLADACLPVPVADERALADVDTAADLSILGGGWPGASSPSGR